MNVLMKSVKLTARIIEKNSPAILTAMGVVGVVSTSVLAVRATPKAVRIIETAAAFDAVAGDPIVISDYDKVEVVKLVWKEYIPAVAMGLATIGCIVGANTINAKRIAAVAGAYSIAESALKEYRSKVVEVLGEKQDSDIRDSIAKDRLTKNPLNNREVIVLGSGDTMCYDVMSGRYFKCAIDTLRYTQNKMNHQLINEDWVSLNTFYGELGLDPIKMGDDIGWRADNLIELQFSSQLSDDGTPCLVLDYATMPKYDFKRY